MNVDDILICYDGLTGLCTRRVKTKDFISLQQEIDDGRWCVRYYDVWRQVVILPMWNVWIIYHERRYLPGDFGKLSMEIEKVRLERALEAL